MYPGFRWYHYLDRRDNLDICEILKLNEKGCTYKSSLTGIHRTGYWTTSRIKTYIDEGYWAPVGPSQTTVLKALKKHL